MGRVTDAERREVARRLRELDKEENYKLSDFIWAIIATCNEHISAPAYLADLIEPSCDLGPSGWTSFDERPPEPGAPVLCKGKNGAYYVGKPVTCDGERTGEVWVPRGAEYRSPAAWKPVDSPHCDRDALLELADDVDSDADNGMGGTFLRYYARRIREACGVTGDA